MLEKVEDIDTWVESLKKMTGIQMYSVIKADYTPFRVVFYCRHHDEDDAGRTSFRLNNAQDFQYHIIEHHLSVEPLKRDILNIWAFRFPHRFVNWENR